MMQYLSVSNILVIHEYEILKFGGTDGILNLSLLESAAYRPQTILYGEEMFPSIYLKAACLMVSIIKNHPFVDGNKRTGLHSLIVFLELNGYLIELSQKELEQLAIDAEKEQKGIENIVEENSVPIIP